MSKTHNPNPSSVHTGLGHVKEMWNKAAGKPDARNAVARVMDGETFEQSGERVLGELMELLAGQDLSKMTIIDFGCGLGRVTQHLDRLFGRVFAVDIAPRMVEEVRSMGLVNTTALVDDGNGLEMVPMVDIVYSNSVLFHNLKRDTLRLWPNVCGKLRVGGTAAFQLPCYEVPRDPGHWTDVAVWTKAEILSLAKACGCTARKIWVNQGRFTFKDIGPFHHKLHVFTKQP